MKKVFLPYIIVIVLCVVSCHQGRKNEVQYKEYISPDNSYVVSVPERVPQTQYCIGNYMSFADKDEGIIISIQYTPLNYLCDEVTKISKEKYSYSQIEISDTSALYQFSQGLLTAYKYFLIRRFPETNYLISISLLKGSMNGVKEMGDKIYASLKPCRAKEAEAKDQNTLLKADKAYSNSYYTIKYPKEWKAVENINEMTDAYIGSQEEDFGFTIVRFKTDYSISEAHTEGNENVRQAGFRILNDKQITLAGVKCYESLQVATIQGKEIKHLSYLFKKGDMLYSIKFGNLSNVEKGTLADEIIASFRFK